MASNEEILQGAITGIPRVAERIMHLPDEQRQRALEAVERSYLRSVMDLDYADDDAKHFVGAVMDTLRAEVAHHAGDEEEVAVSHESFASLEQLMKLLVRSSKATN